MALQIVILTTLLIYLCQCWIKKRYRYWSIKGIRGPKPIPVAGNFGPLITLKQRAQDLLKDIYTKYPDEKVVGIYQGLRPALLVRDPEMIKQILVTDFDMFYDRGLNNSDSILYHSLLVLSGETWKGLRKNTTPLLTNSKLKKYFYEMEQSVDHFITCTDSLDHNVDHDFQALSKRFATDVIFRCMLGLNTDYEKKKDEFLDVTKHIDQGSLFWWFVEFLDNGLVPNIRRKVEKVKKIFKWIFNINTDTYTEIFFENLVDCLKTGNDDVTKDKTNVIKQLIELQNQENMPKVTDQMIAANAFIYSAAGLEVAAAISSIVFELALHHDVQDKVYKEISAVMNKHESKITYDALYDMTYLQMVFDENLRIHPIAGIIARKAATDYTFSEVEIEAGTRVVISVQGLHMDPLYYENPEVFDPERFSPESKKSIPKYAYLPFGEGPRQCIAVRYAKLKACFFLAAFLKRFKVEATDKTPKQLKIKPLFRRNVYDGGVWVRITRRV